MRYIWKNKRTVRKDISRDLGINPSTVTRNLKVLMDKGIVSIYGMVSTSDTVGRKSEIIGINDSWKKIVGVSIERGEVNVLLVSVSGDVLEEKRMFIEVGAENILQVVKDATAEFLREGDLIAVAVPGIVDGGKVKISMALGLKDYDLKRELERVISRDVFVINDANAAAANFSEKADYLVCFLLAIPYNLAEEVGVGGGIWMDGRIYWGVHRAAGEAGIGVRLIEGKGTIEDLKAGKFGLQDMKKFVDEMGRRMAPLAQFIDPQLVVISGDVDLLPEEVREALVEKVKSELFTEMDVIVDLEGGKSVARGAAIALMNEIMNDLNVMEEYVGV